MGGPPRRLVSLIGAVLLLAAVLLTLHNVYYTSPARPWPDVFLRPDVGGHLSEPGRGQLGITEEQLREDRNGLRTILSPEHHIHREAYTIRLRWNITIADLAPDGVRKQVYLINGQFPGPTIEARSGDELEIEVINSAENDEGISIHWHGLSIKGANEMDGVIGLTQCEISKGQTFVYKYRIQETESGTFWYHAHSSVHLADGLYGGIVVHRPVGASGSHKRIQQDYDAEQLLLIGDWYHRKAQSVLDWYEDTQNFGFEPAPDSILINGRGHFNCSMAVKAFPVECGIVDRPQLKLYGTRTRLRIINTGALAGYNIAIPRASLDLIEIDGGNTVVDSTPSESLGVLYPGERMDIIVQQQPQATPEGTFIVALDKENLKFKNFALTPTQTFSLTWDSAPGSTSPNYNSDASSVAKHFNLADAHGPVPSEMPLSTPDVAVFYTRLEILAFHENAPLGVVNHSSWFVEDANATPLLGKDRHEWAATITPPAVFGDLEMQRDVPWYRQSGPDRWMDIVVNNLDEKGHPFHLHGHQFYVVSSHMSAEGQYGAYNPFGSKSEPGGKFNLDSPVRKDTVYVPRMGYVVLRVRMDNEGLWMLHCHSLWHHGAGMGIAIQIGESASIHVKNKAKELCRA